MKREIFEVREYNGKKYTFYKGKPGDWDIPVECDDGRKIPPYKKEIMEVYEKGKVIFSNNDSIDED